MAYNLAGIRQRILEDKLDDTEFNPDIVDNFINDAQRSIFNTYELPFMEIQTTETLTSGSYTFDWPDDYQVEQAIIIISPTSNVKDITTNFMPWREFIRSYPNPSGNTPAMPSTWTTYGRTMYLTAPTDQSYTISLWYLKTPTPLLRDNDIPELPEEFEEALVLGAYYRILERNEDFDLASFYKNGDYTDELYRLVGRLSNRQIGAPTVMPQPRRFGGTRRRGRR